MNRRDFLTRVLGASAALAVLPKLDLLAATLPQAEAEAVTGPVWLSTFQAIHEEAWRLYKRYMNASPYPILSDHVLAGYRLIGEILPVRVPTHQLFEPVTLTDQYHVKVDSADSQRSIEPAMRALTQRVQWSGLDYYGTLNIDLPGAIYAANRGPLRMVAQYSVMSDLNLIGFDVLGGASASAKSQASKARLRERLTRYPMPRLNPLRLPA